jgi:hypothetical protein
LGGGIFALSCGGASLSDGDTADGTGTDGSSGTSAETGDSTGDGTTTGDPACEDDTDPLAESWTREGPEGSGVGDIAAANGTVAIVGWSEDGTAVELRDGASGDSIWGTAETGVEPDGVFPRGVAMAAGKVGVVGTISGAGSDTWVARYDAADGSLDWAQRVDTGGFETGFDLVFDGDALVVTGSVSITGETKLWVRRFEDGGTEAWNTEFLGLDDAGASGFAIAADPDGGWVVAGEQTKSDTTKEGLSVRIRPDGSRDWGGPHPASDGFISSLLGIANDPAGSGGHGYYVVGAETEQTDDFTCAGQAWVGRLDPLGSETWSRSIDLGAAHDTAADVIALGEDEMVVAGTTGICNQPNAGGSGQIWVSLLDRDGGDLWSETLSGYAYSGTSGVAADGDAVVYVGGTVSDGEYGPSHAWLRRYERCQ